MSAKYEYALQYRPVRESLGHYNMLDEWRDLEIFANCENAIKCMNKLSHRVPNGLLSYIFRVSSRKVKGDEMIECPVPGGFFDCPNCDISGFCTLANPLLECDDYYAVVGDEEK